jgi:hypothetical protein
MLLCEFKLFRFLIRNDWESKKVNFSQNAPAFCNPFLKTPDSTNKQHMLFSVLSLNPCCFPESETS